MISTTKKTVPDLSLLKKDLSSMKEARFQIIKLFNAG